MKTIKLPYTSSEELSFLFKQYSNVVRYSYCRFQENKTEKEIRLLIKSVLKIKDLTSIITK